MTEECEAYGVLGMEVISMWSVFLEAILPNTIRVAFRHLGLSLGRLLVWFRAPLPEHAR